MFSDKNQWSNDPCHFAWNIKCNLKLLFSFVCVYINLLHVWFEAGLFVKHSHKIKHKGKKWAYSDEHNTDDEIKHSIIFAKVVFVPTYYNYKLRQFKLCLLSNLTGTYVTYTQSNLISLVQSMTNSMLCKYQFKLLTKKAWTVFVVKYFMKYWHSENNDIMIILNSDILYWPVVLMSVYIHRTVMMQ